MRYFSLYGIATLRWQRQKDRYALLVMKWGDCHTEFALT